MERRHPKQGHRVNGAAIAEFRARRNITSALLATKCGISVKHLDNIAAGRMPASLEVACRIADAIGVPGRDFIEDPEVLDSASTLQRRRLAAGLTRSEVARKAGISRQHLNHVEIGRKTPSLGLLRRLAAVYGCEAGEFIDNSAAA